MTATIRKNEVSSKPTLTVKTRKSLAESSFPCDRTDCRKPWKLGRRNGRGSFSAIRRALTGEGRFGYKEFPNSECSPLTSSCWFKRFLQTIGRKHSVCVIRTGIDYWLWKQPAIVRISSLEQSAASLLNCFELTVSRLHDLSNHRWRHKEVSHPISLSVYYDFWNSRHDPFMSIKRWMPILLAISRHCSSQVSLPINLC